MFVVKTTRLGAVELRLLSGVVVDDVVAVSAVLRMHDSRATTFGSRCFNKSMIFRIQI